MSMRHCVVACVALFLAGTLGLLLSSKHRDARIHSWSSRTSGQASTPDAGSNTPAATHLASPGNAAEPPTSPQVAPAGIEPTPRRAAAKSHAANQALADIARALDETDPPQRTSLVCAAIATWATTDIDAAGAWSLAPTGIDRRTALRAAIRGGAAADPVAATRFVGQLSTESPAEALVLGHELILALSETGHYSTAAAWVTAGQQPNPAWINDAYARWASADRDAALASATAIAVPAARAAAIAAVTNAATATVAAQAGE